jgi:phenylpyruvate tautomerase PptA (4-oxalocrotonate tautomerase family)
MTDEQKRERREKRELVKTLARVEAEKNQKPVKSVTINIEWRKSRMWGTNPHCDAVVSFTDGTFHRSKAYTASGCGYDKESTVVADVFNDYLKYKLWALSADAVKGGHGSMDKGQAPYGINSYSPEHRSFAGGIGISCYYNISEYIGGIFEHVASGKTFDVYKYTNKG